MLSCTGNVRYQKTEGVQKTRKFIRWVFFNVLLLQNRFLINSWFDHARARRARAAWCPVIGRPMNAHPGPLETLFCFSQLYSLYKRMHVTAQAGRARWELSADMRYDIWILHILTCILRKRTLESSLAGSPLCPLRNPGGRWDRFNVTVGSLWRIEMVRGPPV